MRPQSSSPRARAALRVDAGQRLLRGQAEERRRPCSWRAAARSSARCRGCSRWRRAIGTPAARSSGDRRRLGLAQRVEGAGQHDRDGAGGRPWRRRRRRRGIRGGRPRARRSSAASAGAAEVRRAARRGSSPAGRASRAAAKTAGDLGGREGDALAEGVDGVDQALGVRRRAASGCRPRRCRRRASRPRARRGRRGSWCGRAPGGRGPIGARDAQHAELGLAVEAVAGLDLDRGDALGEQRVDARQARRRAASPRRRPGWRAPST